ncbi:hypothetical protein [Streptomyces sp. UG1]|uniref:hypothetical protein n=1 Tax=Streptomyces sp. UG1 TaxID=3417652 RepID=UPI003CF3D57B
MEPITAGLLEERARQLAEPLNGRADQDPDFARALDIWRRRAGAEAGTRTGAGDVRNEISSGTVHGAVVQEPWSPCVGPVTSDTAAPLP